MVREQGLREARDLRAVTDARSTHLLSLSGWSGIFVGILATGGVLFAKWVLSQEWENTATSVWLAIDALVVLVLAVGISVFITARRARRRHELLWSPAAQGIVKEMATPLAAGGVYTFILLRYQMVSAIPGTMLLFYGLGLCAAAKFTRPEIRHLGWVQIALGLASLHVTNQALLYWAMGFGLAHIFYGVLMYFKHEL
jgi:hypothetical protein